MQEMFMLKVGSEVVTMSAPGRFRVIAIDGPILRIANDAGQQKLVHVTNVRTIDRASDDVGAPKPAASK